MTNAQTRPAGGGIDAPSVSAERSHWTLVAVALATFMTYLDNNIVNVAIPAIERDLHPVSYTHLTLPTKRIV